MKAKANDGRTPVPDVFGNPVDPTSPTEKVSGVPGAYNRGVKNVPQHFNTLETANRTIADIRIPVVHYTMSLRLLANARKNDMVEPSCRRAKQLPKLYTTTRLQSLSPVSLFYGVLLRRHVFPHRFMARFKAERIMDET
jgi:hypothetical protein